MSFRSADLPGIARAGLALALAVAWGRGAEGENPQLQELAGQNRALQEQVRAQQKTIDDLTAKMADVLRASERHERELRGMQGQLERPAPAGASAADRGREVRIAAETGIAFFNTGSDGQFPKAEFRVDDPVITIEAPVWKKTYFFAELKLLPREANLDNFQLGELYVDFEDVSAAWGRPGMLGFRAGRLNTPFGEEYQRRGPLANPLISHSVSDIWGTDEGMEIYGTIGPAHYVVAVQNGGVSRLRDFNADKAVVARVGWDPARWLHVSGSAMRTGELATVADNLSDLWFGNAFFRALGPANRTGKFWADLFEADATARWKNGHASMALGQARFDDSDPLVDNSRRLRYGYLEMEQIISNGLYGAARYSEIRVPGGYPLAGWGQLGTYFFRPSLTEELRRLSVGLGYRFGPPLVLKFEYGWESRRMRNSVERERLDFLGSEIGVKF